MIAALLMPLLYLNEVRDVPLEPGYCVAKYADQLAEEVAAEGRIRHGLVDEALDGCDRSWVGQVVAVSPVPFTMAEAVGWWMDSPAHRDILLNPKASRAGVGRAQVDGFYVAVVNFAR